MPAETPGQADRAGEERDELSSMATCTVAAVGCGEGKGMERGLRGSGSVSMWHDSLRGDCLMCQKWQQEAEAEAEEAEAAKATIKHTKLRRGEWRKKQK